MHTHLYYSKDPSNKKVPTFYPDLSQDSLNPQSADFAKTTETEAPNPTPKPSPTHTIHQNATYKTLIPDYNEINLESSVKSKSPQKTLCFFCNQLLRNVILSFAIIALLGTFLRTFKRFYCASFEATCSDDFKHYFGFFAVNRIAATIIYLPILIYVISNATSATIFFSDSNEITKWDIVSQYFGYFGELGMYHTVLFTLLTAFSTYLFEPNSELLSSTSVPADVLNIYVFVMTVGVYLLLFGLNAVLKGGDLMNIPEFELSNKNMNTETDWFMFKTSKQDGSSKPVVLIFNVLTALIILALISLNAAAAAYIFMYSLLDWEAERIVCFFFKFALIFCSMPKHFMYLMQTLKTKRKTPTGTFFLFLRLYFETSFLLECMEKNAFNIAIFWTFIGLIIAGFVFAIIFMIDGGQIHAIIREKLREPAKCVIEAGFAQVLSINICLGTIIPLLDTASDFLSDMSENSVVNVTISWCKTLGSSAASDLLTTFYPNQSLLRFGNMAWNLFNVEAYFLFVVIALLILLGWRPANIKMRSFANVWRIVIVYMCICIFRMDGIADTIAAGVNLGYAELNPSTTALNSYTRNLHVLFIAIWILVSTRIDHKKGRDNEDSSVSAENTEENDGESSMTITDESKEDRKSRSIRFLEGFLVKIIQLALAAFTSYYIWQSFAGDWLEITPRDFNAESTTNPNLPESLNKSPGWAKCDAQREPSHGQTQRFIDASLNLVSLSERIFEQDDHYVDKMSFEKFGTKLGRMGFLVIPFAAVVLSVTLLFEEMDPNVLISMCAMMFFALFINLLVLIASYFMVYTSAVQLPWLFNDVLMGEGIVSAFLSQLLAMLLLGLIVVDTVAPFGAPAAISNERL